MATKGRTRRERNPIIFAPGDRVICAEPRSNPEAERIIWKRYGEGPFEVVTVSRVPECGMGGTGHPQFLTLKNQEGEDLLSLSSPSVAQRFSGWWFEKCEQAT